MPRAVQRKTSVFLVVFLVVLSAVAVCLSFRYDAPIREAIVASQGKDWKKSDANRFYSAVRVYGDWPWLMAGGAVGLLVAWKLKNREWTQILIAAIVASTLSGVIANTSRLTTGRTRPKESPAIASGFYGPWKDGKLTIGDPRYNSFPSGHTATAFGFAGAIFYGNPWFGIAALILAALVGWSSIITGNHHPSDAVVSIVLSMVVAWFTWQQVQKYAPFVWLWLRRKLKRP